MQTEDSAKETFELALLGQNRRWLAAYILSLTGNPVATDDLVQEVFATALQNQARYNGSHPVGAWLRGIALNKVREYWRKCKRDPILMDLATMEHLDQAASNMETCSIDPDYGDRRAAALKACVAQLTKRAREMIRLRYEEGTRSKEIGLALKMGAAAVDMALSRARGALRECIARKMEAHEYD